MSGLYLLLKLGVFMSCFKSDQRGGESTEGNGRSSDHRSSLDFNGNAFSQGLVAILTETVAEREDSLSSVESGNAIVDLLLGFLGHEDASRDLSLFSETVLNVFSRSRLSGLSTDLDILIGLVA